MIEHVSYSIGYCKISLPLYSGSSSLSNAGHFFFFDSPGITNTTSKLRKRGSNTRNNAGQNKKGIPHKCFKEMKGAGSSTPNPNHAMDVSLSRLPSVCTITSQLGWYNDYGSKALLEHFDRKKSTADLQQSTGY